MQSVILYSQEQPSPDHQQITIHRDCGPARLLYVRAEQFDGEIDEALAAAKPRPSETVLNTVPMPF